MSYFALAFGLMAHAFFWGAGVALLTMPRPWQRFWPVLAPVAGFALQSAVVWAAVYAGLPGTQSYGWASELIPGVLLLAGVRRPGWRVAADLGRLGAVWLVGAAEVQEDGS